MEFNLTFKGLYPICHLLTLVGAHHILHVSEIKDNIGDFSYIACLLGILIACRNKNVVIICTAQLNEGVCSGYAPDLHSEDAWFDSQATLTYLFFMYFSRHSI
jgi:hypothetical protein